MSEQNQLVTMTVADEKELAIRAILDVVYNKQVTDAASLITEATADWDKDSEANRNAFVKRMFEILKIYLALKNNGVTGIPEEFTKRDLKWGFNVDVKNTQEFRKIHKAIGALEHSSKDPVGDGRTNKVRVTLTPKEHTYAKYFVNFSYIRKLTPHDKCKVVTQVTKRTTVVCNNES